MAELKIPQKTLQDNFNLQDFKDDFNALNSEIEKNKEIANTWETFKNSGGEIGGAINFTSGATIDNITKPITISGNTMYYRENVTNNAGFSHLSRFEDDSLGGKVNQNGIEFRKNYGGTSGSFRPMVDNALDLGSSNYKWKDIYLNGINKKSNGYTKLPNGLIMQWGKFTVNLSGGGDNSSKITNCTFPIRFVNDVVNQGAICTYNLSSKGISWTSAINCSAMVNSLSEITIESRAINSSTPNNNFEIRWFAIGY